MKKNILFILISIFTFQFCDAQINLIKDINAEQTLPCTPKYLVNDNDTLYFIGQNKALLQTLFRINVITGQIQELRHFEQSAFIYGLVIYNGKLQFILHNSPNENGIWQSDGTVAGTILMKPIPNISSQNPDIKYSNFNGKLYFSVADSTNGNELWTSDGTSSGTFMLANFNAGPNNSYPQNFKVYNNKIIFIMNNGTAGYELYSTDGTAANTVLIKDIYTGAGSSEPGGFIEYNGKLYFAATSQNDGREIWETDGTAAGTIQSFDLNPGSSSSKPSEFCIFNGLLYFAAEINLGKELYQTDGTLVGTILVKDIKLGFFGSDPSLIDTLNGKLLIACSAYNSGRELWESDGTDAGTVLLKDINVGTASSNLAYFYRFDNEFYFIANNGIHGNEVWKTDGTAVGTQMLKDINQKATGSQNPWPGMNIFVKCSNGIFFAASDLYDDDEIWKTTGTSNTTLRYTDCNISTKSAVDALTFYNRAFFQNNLYFTAYDQNSGSEIWKTDGTTAGTSMLKDINVGSASNYATNFTVLNNELIFTAIDSVVGNELWKTDGTAAGTVLVKDIIPGTININPYNAPKHFITFNGAVYFQAHDGADWGLWKTDGTTAGTVKIKNILFNHPIVFNNKIYFNGSDNLTSFGIELYSTDGTSNGTILVKDILPGSLSSNAMNFVIFNNELFFTAFDANFGREIWKTDGTAAGIAILKDISPGIGNGVSDDFANNSIIWNNKLFFVGNEPNTGGELWSTDGTTAGTQLAVDIIPGTDPSYPYNFVAFNNELYFLLTFSSPMGTRDFWKSNGTTATKIKPFFYCSSLIHSNGNLYLSAGDIGKNWLQKSDGTTLGTFAVDSNIYFSNITYAREIIELNGNLVFPASRKSVSAELFSYCTSNPNITSFTGNSIESFNANGGHYYINSCEKICQINETDIPANIKASVFIDQTTLPNNLVRRHYEINPKVNMTFSPSTITLYFKQSEFTEFNLNNSSLADLPQDSLDFSNLKSNLLITHFINDTSTSINGFYNTYNNSTKEIINPLDNDITWNKELTAWQVKFNVDQLKGGYFITVEKPSGTEELPDDNPKIYPNPVAQNLFIDAPNSILTNQKIIITDVLGRIMLESIMENANQKIDVGSFNAGVYILKIGQEKYIKFVKL